MPGPPRSQRGARAGRRGQGQGRGRLLPGGSCRRLLPLRTARCGRFRSRDSSSETAGAEGRAARAAPPAAGGGRNGGVTAAQRRAAGLAGCVGWDSCEPGPAGWSHGWQRPVRPRGWRGGRGGCWAVPCWSVSRSLSVRRLRWPVPGSEAGWFTKGKRAGQKENGLKNV